MRLNRNRKKQQRRQRRNLLLAGAGVGGVGLAGGLLLRSSKQGGVSLPSSRIVEIDRRKPQVSRALAPTSSSPSRVAVALPPSPLRTSRKVIESPALVGQGTGRGGAIARYQPTTLTRSRQKPLPTRMQALKSRIGGALAHVKGQGRHHPDYVPAKERVNSLRRRSGRPTKEWGNYRRRNKGAYSYRRE